MMKYQHMGGFFMGEYRNNECCEPKECCCRPNPCCESNGNDNSIWMIILVVVIICLLCGGNDNKGGLFGGLF